METKEIISEVKINPLCTSSNELEKVPEKNYEATLNRLILQSVQDQLVDTDTPTNSPNPRSPKIERRDSCSPRSRSSNNLVFSTLVGNPLQRLISLIKFVLLKIMAPLFTFTFICSMLVYAHIQIADYCFYSPQCLCRNTLIYVYTAIKEVLYVQSGTIIVLYYGTSYVTNGFFKKEEVRTQYFGFILLVLAAYFCAQYVHRKDQYYGELITISGYCLMGANYLSISLMTLFHGKINREFMKRMATVSILALYLFFHRFYLKNYAMAAFLHSLVDYFGKNLGLSVFKIALMGYYSIYEYLTGKLLFLFFERILKEDSLSYNIAIFTAKFVSVDALSINAFNVLTLPLTEVYAWISFFYYLYSNFSCYTRTDIVLNFLIRSLRRLRGKKANEQKKEEDRFYEDLKSGCIFETNLIVFLRIISFKTFRFFVIFTPEPSLYLNCSLQERASLFELYDANVTLLMTSHTLLLVALGVVVYVFKREEYLFDYHVEEMSVFCRFFLFLTCFSYADYTLQIYKAFQDI